MTIRVAVTLFTLALVVPCFGQTTQSDSQTLQAILAEIRAIHQEVKTTQSTQILLTELGIQQSVVNRATQRVDDAQSKLNDIKAAERDEAATLVRGKEKLDETTDPREAKDIADQLEQIKGHAAVLAALEPDRTNNLQSAQQQLKDAQEALDDIQNQLNTIVKQLTPSRN
jgi:hypothetical protein